MPDGGHEQFEPPLFDVVTTTLIAAVNGFVGEDVEIDAAFDVRQHFDEDRLKQIYVLLVVCGHFRDGCGVAISAAYP